MRSDAVIAGTVYIGQVFKYVVVIDGAIRVGYNAPDAMNVAVVLSKPDGVRGWIRSGNAVGPTIEGRRGILGDDMCGGGKFADLIGSQLGKPEMPVLCEGEIKRAGFSGRHRPLGPVAARIGFPDRIAYRLRKPEIA